MAQTVTLFFRDGTEETYPGSTLNVAGDFLIVETETSEFGGVAEFYPAGSLRKALLSVDMSEEVAAFEAAEDEDDGGASIS